MHEISLKEELAELFEEFWLLDNTKERISSYMLKSGLLNYGLFSNKVPPCFTTRGLLEIVNNNDINTILDETDEKKLKKSLDCLNHDHIRYEAMRETNISRNIGIPHPEAYIVQVLAIEKNWREIVEYCNKPEVTFSRVYVRQLSSGRVFEMNYKGSERYENEETELAWMTGAQYVVKADIASCFPSMYTHSIPWALNGKDQAKSNSSLGLSGNLLDKCTQNTRDKQTNGLLIGPHTSNIISEIILTSIDSKLQEKGYKKVIRYIDDYTFYADNYEEAERFVKHLVLALRTYELSLNEKKTNIAKLPQASLDYWINALQSFNFENGQEVAFSAVRRFLDLALQLSQDIEKYTPINYALKFLSNNGEPKKLNERAKRLYTQEAINLAILHPYLVPILDKHVFDSYSHDSLIDQINKFVSILIKQGLEKIQPDILAHALYYALKHDIKIDISDKKLGDIISLDDCLSNTLLREYTEKHNISFLKKEFKNKSIDLKKSDKRTQDKQWLLIYNLWNESALRGNGQNFLADLKKLDFKFINFDSI